MMYIGVSSWFAVASINCQSNFHYSLYLVARVR
jgi:hypothetical protein